MSHTFLVRSSRTKSKHQCHRRLLALDITPNKSVTPVLMYQYVSIATTSVSLVTAIETDIHPNTPSVYHTDVPNKDETAVCGPSMYVG